MSNDKVYYVYAHKRLDNGEVFYIGKGKNSRMSRTTYRSESWKAVALEVGFEPVVVRSGLTEEEALDFEKESIVFFRSIGQKLCNITNGRGLTGYKHTGESKIKMSFAAKGRVKSAEHKKKLSVATSINRVGKRHSLATRLKMLSAQRTTGVVCSNGMSFDSANSAGKWIKGDVNYRDYRAAGNAIRDCCKGNRSTSYGYSWKFLESQE